MRCADPDHKGIVQGEIVAWVIPTAFGIAQRKPKGNLNSSNPLTLSAQIQSSKAFYISQDLETNVQL